MNTLLSTETCATTTGSGLRTTWTISGTENAYAAELTTTDGYSITASFVYTLLSSSTTANGSDCTAVTCAIGTCVETLDTEGAVIAATVTDEGNMAICHWFYQAITTINVPGVNTGSVNNYSETRYLQYADWGTAGSNVIGSTVMNAGNAIGATHGFVRTPSTKPSVYTTRTYTMFWYQPTWEHTYVSTTLRRYNGGESNGDKVRAYCAGLRPTDSTASSYVASTALVPATVNGNVGVITLTGAKMLATSAIALGSIMLAF